MKYQIKALGWLVVCIIAAAAAFVFLRGVLWLLWQYGNWIVDIAHWRCEPYVDEMCFPGQTESTIVMVIFASVSAAVILVLVHLTIVKQLKELDRAKAIQEIGHE